MWEDELTVNCCRIPDAILTQLRADWITNVPQLIRCGNRLALRVRRFRTVLKIGHKYASLRLLEDGREQLHYRARIKHLQKAADRMDRLAFTIDSGDWTESPWHTVVPSPKSAGKFPPDPPFDISYPVPRVAYRLRVRYLSDRIVKREGAYTRCHVPEDWFHEINGFIEDVFGHAATLLVCEDPDFFNHGGADEVKCCRCIFSPGGKSYQYLTDNEDIRVGDWVEVPVGEEKSPRFARVVSARYYAPKEAPYPVRQSKYILRRLSGNDIPTVSLCIETVRTCENMVN